MNKVVKEAKEILLKNLEEHREYNKALNIDVSALESEDYPPDLEIGDIIELRAVWGGDEEYTHYEENGASMGSTAYNLEGGEYINYVFAIVTPGETWDGEKSEDAMDTIVKIVDIEII